MRLSSALLAGVTGVAALTTSARANLTAVFTGNTANVYNYTLRFTVDQPGEQLRNGDFITLYDVAPLANITSATAATGFSLTEASIGQTPTGLGPPAINDNGSLMNLTFTYTGATVSAATDFVGTKVTTNGTFTGVQPGKAAGTTSFTLQGDQLSTNVTSVPLASSGGTPEPASLGLLSLGAAALLVRRRKA